MYIVQYTLQNRDCLRFFDQVGHQTKILEGLEFEIRSILRTPLKNGSSK
jgi:hypothetical protein